MTKRKTDHVVIGDNTFRCLHCGDEYAIGMPCSIGMMVAMGRAFGDDHKACKPDPAVHKKRFVFKTAAEWINGWDTGVSSKTIWYFMMGRPFTRGDIPHDPADFGRCHRLLTLMPEWRARMKEMAVKIPRWTPYVDAWAEMTALYDEELPSGSAPKLCALMERLARPEEPTP